MKEKFNKIEEHLQHLIEQNTARLFSSTNNEKMLAHVLVEAMQGNRLVNKNGEIEIPANFTIYIHPSYVKDVSTNESLLKHLASQIKEATNENGIKLVDFPDITVLPDSNILEGEFRIQAHTFEETQDETTDLGGGKTEDHKGIPEKAFFILSGSKIFPLIEKVVNIGRNKGNHLVIDDPRVSRKHAQLRVANSEYMIFDLDSSSGTNVNGEPITHATLVSGDVISFFGYRLVYAQDAVRRIDISQEIFSPKAPDDHATKILQPKDNELD